MSPACTALPQQPLSNRVISHVIVTALSRQQQVHQLKGTLTLSRNTLKSKELKHPKLQHYVCVANQSGSHSQYAQKYTFIAEAAASSCLCATICLALSMLK